MARHHSNKKPSRTTWQALKEDGLLSERHVQMGIGLGFQAATIMDEHRRAKDGAGLLLLEWLEDRYFAQFGTVSPVDDSATPDAQQEHPAENSLLPDPTQIVDEYLRNQLFAPGSDDEPDDWHEAVGGLIQESEKNTPVSYGEIHEEDQAMLRRQEDFRKAARALTAKLAQMTSVQKVALFGSVPLPLWKEVPRFARLRARRIKVFHECANIDMAVWVTNAEQANDMRRAVSTTVAALNANDVHLQVAHHHFSIHLVDHATARYLGVVCHYNKCPKHKPACQVPGCGAQKFVQILPWFQLKPERLGTHNSQVLYQRQNVTPGCP